MPRSSMPHVEFIEATHTYLVDKVEYPSVSTVLNVMVDLSRVPRDKLEYKRMIGRATHRCIELYEAGELDVESVDPQIVPYLEGWIRLKSAKPFRVLAAEKIVYSMKYRVAGRLDILAELDSDIWLLDAKCTYEMAPSTALQTAGYTLCVNEMGEYKVTKRAGVQLKPDGSFELYPYTEKSDERIFLNAVALHSWKKNHA